MIAPVAVDEPTEFTNYRTEWYCEPPEWRSQFKAIKQTWNDDFTIRKIYEWSA